MFVMRKKEGPAQKREQHEQRQGLGKSPLYLKNISNFIFTYINNTWVHLYYKIFM